MNSKLAHLLTRLYPGAWRKRYGTEFEEHLQGGPGQLRSLADVVSSALGEHLFPTIGGTMDQHGSFGVLVRKPSAFLPLAMSLTALSVVLIHVAIFGAAREPDEGATAHIWQLLMAGQVPVLAFFMIKWLPRAPRQTLYVLALQAGAALASVAPVFLLKL
jgi:hypothetical protein